MGCSSCNSCGGSSCNSSPLPKSRSTTDRKDLDPDDIRHKCPTKNFFPGDKVYIPTMGEECEVIRCNWHYVFVRLGGKEVGFRPKDVEKKCSCDEKCEDCKCKNKD